MTDTVDVRTPTVSMSAPDSDGMRSFLKRPAGTATLCALLVVVPILFLEYVPLVDYPNHIARAYVLSGVSSSPELLSKYTVNYAPIPNVAADVVLTSLIRVFGVLPAARLFVAIILSIWCVGVIALSRSLWGRVQWMAAPAILLSLHGPLQYGFVNYAFGAGCCLVALAAWLRWCQSSTPSRFALTVLSAFVTYFSHLAAFGVLGVAAASIVLRRVIAREMTFGRAVLCMAPLTLPLVLLLMFMQKGGDVGAIPFNSVAGKAIAAFSVIRTYDVRFDIAIALVIAVAGCFLLCRALRAPQLNFSADAAAAAAGLLCAFLLLPKDLFTSSGADARVPPILAAIAALAVTADLSSRTARTALVALTGALLLRTAVVQVEWMRLSDRVQSFTQMIGVVPRGAAVVPYYSAMGNLDHAKRHRVLEHAPYYLVPGRDAYVPMMFAIASQQPLIAKQWGWDSISPARLLANHLSAFEYVVATGDSAIAAVNATHCCTSFKSNADAELFHVSAPKP